MKIGIVGWGLEAQSAFRFFGPDHEYLIVNESPQDNFPAQTDKVRVQFGNQPSPVGIGGQVTDLSYLNGIELCDKIVFQPTAIFNLQKTFGDNQAFWAKATTAYDIFFENVPTKNIIGVTGTKGKGTTSTLIAEVLKACGLPVHIGGNIGTPILDMLSQIQADDWVVWELANFQLKAAHHSPHIGVCLMITEEHMDWHPNMDDYIDAKANLFKYQTSDDIAIYLPSNEFSTKIAGASPGKKLPYFEKPGAFVRGDGMIVMGNDEIEIAHKSEVKLLGNHNLENVCAAITAAWQVCQEPDVMKAVIATFAGLEYRLEFVRELNGVSYFNDSFGTTPDTTLVAVKSFDQPIVLILGGHDKGADYEKLARDVLELKVKHVVTIGKISDRLTKEFDRCGYNNYSIVQTNMADVVTEAAKHAVSGDIVLLSAGTSSFGMFKDYKDRGNQFRQAVKELS